MGSNAIHKVARTSKIFPTLRVLPSSTKVNSKSYKHFIECGIIAPLSTGFFAWLPTGFRAVNKLINLIEHEMKSLNAQRILLPSLTESHLWKRTGRMEKSRTELFMLEDRHEKEYILSPTYEEQISKMIASFGLMSQSSFPLRLYQISSKWRDERRPRTGFIRSREFLMKDLYTFDTNVDNAKETYHSVCQVYNNIFQKIGIDTYKVAADSGIMGGNLSHEYHYLSEFGDDTVLVCPSCQFGFNKAISNESHCPECKQELSEQIALEIGHTFYLEEKYSKPLNLLITDSDTKKPVFMGCYGIGIDRLVTAAVEILSTNSEMRWPKCLVPYTVAVIGPKRGSKEESANQYVDKIIEIMNNLSIETVLDDRTELSVGQRLKQAKQVGYLYAIVVNKIALQEHPLFEIHDIYSATRSDLSLESLQDYFKEVTKDSELKTGSYKSTKELENNQSEKVASLQV